MRYLLAVEEGGIPLLLSSPESAEHGAKQINLAPVFRPVPRSLRGDRPVIVRLGLAKQFADSA